MEVDKDHKLICSLCGNLSQHSWKSADDIRFCTGCLTTSAEVKLEGRNPKPVQCVFCKFTGFATEIEELVFHQERCVSKLVVCPFSCGLFLQKRGLSVHLSRDCKQRSVLCAHCEQAFFADEVDAHLFECVRGLRGKSYRACRRYCAANFGFMVGLRDAMLGKIVDTEILKEEVKSLTLGLQDKCKEANDSITVLDQKLKILYGTVSKVNEVNSDGKGSKLSRCLQPEFS